MTILIYKKITRSIVKHTIKSIPIVYIFENVLPELKTNGKKFQVFEAKGPNVWSVALRSRGSIT